MTSDRVAFSEHSVCRKCGCDSVRAYYQRIPERRIYEERHLEVSNTILRTCSRCGFKWLEDPLDQPVVHAKMSDAAKMEDTKR